MFRKMWNNIGMVFLKSPEGIYNRFQNILRLFHVSPNFPFTASETMREFYLPFI